eukprot:CAMPEP_0172527466 /NCGR_PEP_ID=MMETSP1067-20121228/2140_1 /TAXON_ID=265564 ORGANISM="Thalassiosira punctigera, Strain Tpunct2005C2" /NCGR_SAMPLE_ID=MMETSP1067 /ASSEMBLY_ACC=CAM_ASM_000444 /LENGTH=279 /DNA_ID=CAMNT_0013311209 /DNA_START=13 /DNA_END=853 /DNA_ORIENTATION=-
MKLAIATTTVLFNSVAIAIVVAKRIGSEHAPFKEEFKKKSGAVTKALRWAEATDDESKRRDANVVDLAAEMDSRPGDESELASLPGSGDADVGILGSRRGRAGRPHVARGPRVKAPRVKAGEGEDPMPGDLKNATLPDDDATYYDACAMKNCTGMPGDGYCASEKGGYIAECCVSPFAAANNCTDTSDCCHETFGDVCGVDGHCVLSNDSKTDDTDDFVGEPSKMTDDTDFSCVESGSACKVTSDAAMQALAPFARAILFVVMTMILKKLMAFWRLNDS